MSFAPDPLPPAPRPRGCARIVRRLWTSNPFYVLSAALFLYGLRESFAAPGRDAEAVAVTAGLAGYTLLLAAAALFLARYARVWDDIRTVLLLVVLMFLATSVTFDEVLALDPARGVWFYLGGFAFAAGVSESLLRGLRLPLPARFRVPYYLTLGLFFGYPLALAPFLGDPHGEPLLWGLWGFAPAAGLVFLTLLPAARGGPVAGPWPWPYYPWSVFAFLAAAVIGRAVLLCWSFHLFDGSRGELIFGPYFLVPFGWAVAALLVEGGRTAGHRPTLLAAAAAPLGLVALAGVGHRDDPIYAEFLGHFLNRVWATPFHLTLLTAGGFYVCAWARRVPLAADGLTAVLVGLAVTGPEAMGFEPRAAPDPLPLLAAGGLQFITGFGRVSLVRCLVGTGALAVGAVHLLPDGAGWPVGAAVAGQVWMAALLLLGAGFPGGVGRWARVAGTVLVLGFGVASAVVRPHGPGWLVDAYPLLISAVLLAYGHGLRSSFARFTAGGVMLIWLVASVLRGYRVLRADLPGLDYLAVGLVLFPIAVLISLGKGGAISRRTVTRWALFDGKR